MNGNGNKNLWEEAFQLAYFIIPNGACACEVAGNAIEKLKNTALRETQKLLAKHLGSLLISILVSSFREDDQAHPIFPCA